MSHSLREQFLTGYRFSSALPPAVMGGLNHGEGIFIGT